MYKAHGWLRKYISQRQWHIKTSFYILRIWDICTSDNSPGELLIIYNTYYVWHHNHENKLIYIHQNINLESIKIYKKINIIFYYFKRKCLE